MNVMLNFGGVMKKSIILLFTCLLFSACQKDLARSNPLDPLNDTGISYVVSGTVKNTQNMPYMGVPVKLQSSTGTTIASVTSMSDGKYTFGNIPVGTYNLVCEAPWCNLYSQSLSVTNSSLAQDISLTEKMLKSENFTSYSFGIAPNSGWLVESYDGGTCTVDANGILPFSDPNCCKFYNGTVSSGYARLKYATSLPVSNKGVWVRWEQGSANPSMLTSGVKITSGYTYTDPSVYLETQNAGAAWIKYGSPSSPTNSATPSLGIENDVVYYFDVKIDKENNTVDFKVWKNIILLVTESKPFAGAGMTPITVYFENAASPSANSTYMDNIKIVMK